MDVADITQEHMAALQAKGYTEADLGMLAATEIESLLAPERTEEDQHDAAAARQDATPTPAAAAPAAPAEEDRQPAQFVPQYKAEVPADVNEQITAAQAREEAEFQRLMDGEIDAETYMKVKREVAAQVDTLRTQAITASVFEQANAQTAEQMARAEWTRAEAASFNAFKAEGLDYKNNPALLAAYNVHLKALGTDEKNERRDSAWFLAEAHRLTKESLGIAGARPKPQVTSSGVDIADLPPTLRSVPVAAVGMVGGDEFAHMRNLSGLELERAHAALTDAQRDRYMNE